MPDRRLQVDGQLPAPVVTQPVAAPVDTYTGPGQAGVQLAQLAKSLSSVSPELQRLAGVMGEREDAEQRQQGQEEAFKAAELDGKNYAEAVRSGKIPATASPFWRAGFGEQYGRVSADKWGAQAMLDLRSNSALQSAVDPTQAVSAADHYLSQHLNDWLKNNADNGLENPAFMLGFQHRAEARKTALLNMYASELNTRAEKTSYQAHFEEIVQHIEDSTGKADPQSIADDITKLNQSLYKQGRDGSLINATTVDAITAAAEKHPELGSKILDLMDLVKTGPEGGQGKLGLQQYAIKKLVAARTNVADAMWKQSEQEQKASAAAKKQATDGFLSLGLQTAMQGGNLAPIAEQLGKVNPEAVSTLEQLQKAAGNLGNNTDNKAYQDLYTGIWATQPTTTLPDVIRAYTAGQLSRSDTDKLREDIEKAGQVDAKTRAQWIDDPVYKDAHNGLSTRFQDPITGLLGGPAGDKVTKAKLVFDADWFNYMQGAGAKASTEEKAKWADQETQRVVNSLRGPPLLGHGPPATPFAPDAKQKDKFPKNLVLGEGDLTSLLRQGVTPAFSAKLNQYGVNNPEDLGAFLRDQKDKFIEKYHREPKGTDGKNKPQATATDSGEE